MPLLKIVVPRGVRTCGSCTACCKTHQIEDLVPQKGPGVWCTHCNVGKGCKIYQDRPPTCQAFQCEWLLGSGDDEHRPDKTKVVIDYFVAPNGLPGGVAQMWEVSEGALDHSYARKVTGEALAGGVWVSHIYLGARKKFLFVPPFRHVTPQIEEACRHDGLEIRTEAP